MPESFYLPLGGGRFSPTEHTAGPWSPDAQHFGPPTALLARALENLPSDRPTMIARVSVEILGPAPLAELTVSAQLDRPGRSVELLSAELAAGGRTVARASAWRIATSDSTAVAGGMPAGTPSLPAVESCKPASWPSTWGRGYLNAMEWRLAGGSVDQPGPAAVWARQLVPLVAAEQPSPLQRLCAVADSGNGISNRLDPDQWWFINPELTVHVYREPEGEWIGLDAMTSVGPHGIGTARSTLHDSAGPVGSGAQALLVRTR